ncbi:MAG: phosphate ABC transporter permease subunit PstC [Ignavibacteriae bacterium]|nr:phosphate ABC transporter permease subunit PstC [Ignavibacteriota bacterium]
MAAAPDDSSHAGKPPLSHVSLLGSGGVRSEITGDPDASAVLRAPGRTANRFLVHKPLRYGKKFYIGEFVAERLIQGIAVLSIGFILAIFYYVFQESTWAFRSPEHVVASATSADESLVPESYGGESLQPESFGSGELVPETYGETPGTTDAQPTGSLEAGRAASQGLETSGNDKPVTIGQLVFANDLIDNVPRYIWQPIGRIPKYSFAPLFMGAFKVTLIGILIAAPIAILSALFTTTFAPRWMREVMKPAIEILAGFPSVVIGFFCLITVASIMQEITGSTYRLTSFVGGIGMSLAVIPIIFTVTEDAFAAVPRYMKEASIALGASRWQTAWRVVLPAATPGVFAAIILGFGRAFGETMIALMATGNAALTSWNFFESVRTMSATIGAEMAEVEFHSVHYGVLFLIGAVLFVVTFSLNAIAEFYVRKRLIKRFQGN